MVRLSNLPNELAQNIYQYIDPVDLRSLALTCKAIATFVTDNEPLFKSIYIDHLNEPLPNPNVCWRDELQQYVSARYILRNGSAEDKYGHIEAMADFIGHLSKAPNRGFRTRTMQFLARHFAETTNKEAFMCQSMIYQRSRMTHYEPTFKERQASAKIHTLYGAPVQSICERRWNNSYPYAVSVVYDLRNYTEETLWGPFLPDRKATVDWEKMEAVMVVLGHNLGDYNINTEGELSAIWRVPWKGFGRDSYKGLNLKDSVEPRPVAPFDDPYNITGSWSRVVCFLDFYELFHYNFTGPNISAETPRAPLKTKEAIRFITMDLYAVSREDPGPDDGQELPIVHFEGTARSMHSRDPNANSAITGTVRQTKEGEIRWTSVSIYHGEERWKSEGIQVGGPQSERGVLGHWFDKSWDVHGPAGPTAFWKVSDDIDDRTIPKGTNIGFKNASGYAHGSTDSSHNDDDEDDEGHTSLGH